MACSTVFPNEKGKLIRCIVILYIGEGYLLAHLGIFLLLCEEVELSEGLKPHETVVHQKIRCCHQDLLFLVML